MACARLDDFPDMYLNDRKIRVFSLKQENLKAHVAAAVLSAAGVAAAEPSKCFSGSSRALAFSLAMKCLAEIHIGDRCCLSDRLKMIPEGASLSTSHHSWMHQEGRKEMSIQAVNARNQFKGKVRDIVFGPVVSEVEVETAFVW